MLDEFQIRRSQITVVELIMTYHSRVSGPLLGLEEDRLVVATRWALPIGTRKLLYRDETSAAGS